MNSRSCAICRPLWVVDNDRSLVESNHIEEVRVLLREFRRPGTGRGNAADAKVSPRLHPLRSRRIAGSITASGGGIMANARRERRVLRDRAGQSCPVSRIRARALPKYVPHGTFLVVDDDDMSAGTLARWIRTARWEPVVVKTLAHATLEDDLGGAIVSLDTIDDSAWDRIRTFQVALPAVPLAVLGDQDMATAVQALGFHYLGRPANFASVFGFVDGIRAPQKGPAARENVVEFCKRLGLPPLEAEVLLVGVDTSNHKDICARLGIRDNTLRTLVRRILARARVHGIRAANLKELVARIPTGTSRC
jgi:ActR/RegA family two-component response regulator